VTRIDTGDVLYEITGFDADTFAASVVVDIAGADAARIRIEPSATGAATAWGDERRAWQVLANLVSNALKFSPADAPVRLRVVDTSAGEVRFEVEDCGPGVSPEDQRRIFEKFSTVAAGRRGEGTGLGLYIARSLADGQGGRIQVESKLGKGSTFTFVLPKAGGENRPGGSGELNEQAEPRPILRPVEDSPQADGRAIRRSHHRRAIARDGSRRAGGSTRG